MEAAFFFPPFSFPPFSLLDCGRQKYIANLTYLIIKGRRREGEKKKARRRRLFYFVRSEQQFPRQKGKIKGGGIRLLQILTAKKGVTHPKVKEAFSRRKGKEEGYPFFLFPTTKKSWVIIGMFVFP